MKEQEKILLEKIGKVIFSIREEMGLSQEDVAARCDVDRGKISKIENGSANYYITTLIELSKGLNVDINRFFDF